MEATSRSAAKRRERSSLRGSAGTDRRPDRQEAQHDEGHASEHQLAADRAELRHEFGLALSPSLDERRIGARAVLLGGARVRSLGPLTPAVLGVERRVEPGHGRRHAEDDHDERDRSPRWTMPPALLADRPIRSGLLHRTQDGISPRSDRRDAHWPLLFQTGTPKDAAQRRIASAERSMSSSVVDQLEMEIRIAPRPCQTVPPAQHVPSRWIAAITAAVRSSALRSSSVGSAKRTRTWLRTTSLRIVTPGAAASRSAIRRASAQHRSTSWATPDRPSERSAV
jgi:hypothetical protein